MVNRILSLFLLLILLTSCSSNEKKYDYEEERSYKEYVDISSQKENQQRPQSTQQQTTQNSQSTTMQTSQQQKSETETTKSEDYDPEADDVALLTEEDRDAIWQHYENAVAYVASREDFAAINAFDLKEMVE
jgi:hypothetical protein